MGVVGWQNLNPTPPHVCLFLFTLKYDGQASTWKVDLIHGNLAATLMIFGLGRASNSSVNKDTPPPEM